MPVVIALAIGWIWSSHSTHNGERAPEQKDAAMLYAKVNH
jgi:hypothetical protein